MFSEIRNKIQRAFQSLKTIKISDEYIDWLCLANPGMLNPGNLYCFEYVAKNLPSDNSVLEIGSFCGLSTNTINYFLRKYEKTNKLITADKWIFEGAESGGNRDAKESKI